MPAALTSTRTSPAPGTGRGTSRTWRTSMPPYESNCTALGMKRAPILRLCPSGLSPRYDLGSELDDVGRLIGDKAIRHGDADVSLYEVMQDGMGVLLDASTEGKLCELVAATTP